MSENYSPFVSSSMDWSTCPNRETSRRDVKVQNWNTRIPRVSALLRAALLVVAITMVVSQASAQKTHPPLHQIPAPSGRPLPADNVLYVDGTGGNDANDGSRKTPWKTVGHALTQLEAGETLAIRQGIYFENLYCAVAGMPEKPITIRGYPGEQVIIDGGLPEFQNDPSACWEPLKNGEYRSTQIYRNIRDVLGSFADSNIGLQTYWHQRDLLAQNEMWIHNKKTREVDSVYCGPGLWYDKQTGRIHCRLAHTHIDNERVANYRGETDPRKLPLVIAPFRSLPLSVDQAKHVRFQDLVIRGGGFDTIELNMGINVAFDNVTVFCATYGLRARSTGPLKITNSGFHGGIPPWAFRDENSLHTPSPHFYAPFLTNPESAARNIARLNTHALLVTEGSYEFEVFYYPHNHDWEISHCTFTDGHDGVYLSGHGIHFHHNHVHTIQDDAVYLSSPVHFASDDIHIYQNLITKSLMAFGCHSRGGPGGNIYISRNVADLREGVNISRPRPDLPHGRLGNYHIFLTHGRRLLSIESLYFYQNTFISPASPDAVFHRLETATAPETKRRVFNNLFVYLNRYGFLRPYKNFENDVQIDGNLHWCADPSVPVPKNFLDRIRSSKFSEANKARYPDGWCSHDLVADPKLIRFTPIDQADWRISKDSPAVGAGVPLPTGWQDPLRPDDNSQPDIGALPLGSKLFIAGRPHSDAE